MPTATPIINNKSSFIIKKYNKLIKSKYYVNLIMWSEGLNPDKEGFYPDIQAYW